MKNIVTTIMLILFFTGVSAQKDPAAQKILDKVAEKVQQNKYVKFNFNYQLVSVADDAIDIEQSGTAVVSGDKYRIEVGASILFSDGENIYNYIPEAKEVTVTSPEEEYDEFFLSEPSKIFVLYKDDFKYRLIERFEDSGKNMAQIDLHPDKLERNYFRIRLLIDTDKNEITELQLFEKSGDRYVISLTDYSYPKSYPESNFSFNADNNKDVTVIDMRGL